MDKHENAVISQDLVLREMELWQKDECSMLGEYETLWQMFRAVVTTSSYGSSEFGGPVWLMDFSLANLKKLFPIINDLMECKAQGYGNKADAEGMVCPYPQMKFERYLDYNRTCNHHFQPTSDVFRWRRSDCELEEIKIELPKIDAKYSEFWHRQFPPKENWRVL